MKTTTAIAPRVIAAAWLTLCTAAPVDWSHSATIDEGWRVECGAVSFPMAAPTTEPFFPSTEHGVGCGARALLEPLPSGLGLLQGLPFAGLTSIDLDAVDGLAMFSVVGDTGRHLARQAVEAVVNGVLAPAGAALPPPAEAVATPAAGADVVRTIEAWSRAWSARDAEAYLAHYSPDFSTGETGFSLASWSAQRRSRLIKSAWISVKVREAQVALQGSDAASVRFVQDYRSPALSETSRKVITLRRQGGAWRIVTERTEP